MGAFFTYKRWSLRADQHEFDLLDLVRNGIMPHYGKLDGCVGLQLLRIAGSRSYLAIQRWRSREVWQTTLSSEAYRRWLEEYTPLLDRWDRLVSFEIEWEAEDAMG